ncbi:hypothetical protein [Endozoicomonas elysicola]|nr:hypothetical protein [Endozoicomonas elysicola]
MYRMTLSDSPCVDARNYGNDGSNLPEAEFDNRAVKELAENFIERMKETSKSCDGFYKNELFRNILCRLISEINPLPYISFNLSLVPENEIPPGVYDQEEDLSVRHCLIQELSSSVVARYEGLKANCKQEGEDCARGFTVRVATTLPRAINGNNFGFEVHATPKVTPQSIPGPVEAIEGSHHTNVHSEKVGLEGMLIYRTEEPDSGESSEE